jgi:DNA-binding MarR family transcriptional regulator
MSQRSPLLDSPRPHSFAEYLISIGFEPDIAAVTTPAEYCEERERAWESIFREIRGEKPTADPHKFAPEMVARAARLKRKAPDTSDLLDELDLRLGPDEDRFPFLSAAQLNSGRFETRYLIPGILAAAQPGGIFGAFKTLKTSVTADLLISLASGTPFLGQFRVAEPGRVLFLSGESGLSALQSIARRICKSRSISLETLDNFELSAKLPRLDNRADVRALRRIIQNKKPICVAIDPAYLAIRGDDARNLFAMGSLLRPLADIGDATGCTILVVHHCKHSKHTTHDPATLDDIAWSGFAEFAAQWLLLSRRRRFDADLGRHELWFTAGGRAGHHGLWALDAREGVANGFEPRKWTTAIRAVTMAEAQSDERRFAASEDQRARRTAATFERHRHNVLNFFSKNPEGANARSVRDKLGINGAYVVRVLESLVDEGLLVASELKKLKRTERIYTLSTGRTPTVPSDGAGGSPASKGSTESL